MEMAKRTYSFPIETLKRFESQVAPGKRSAKLMEIIDAWAEERERETIRQGIIEGCKDMWEDYEQVLKEWEPLDREVDRVIELHS